MNAPLVMPKKPLPGTEKDQTATYFGTLPVTPSFTAATTANPVQKKLKEIPPVQKKLKEIPSVQKKLMGISDADERAILSASQNARNGYGGAAMTNYYNQKYGKELMNDFYKSHGMSYSQ
jgi:hypothetical protein